MDDEAKPAADQQPVRAQEPIQEINKPKPTNKKLKKILIHAIFIPLLIVLSAGLTYLWRDQVANKLNTQQADEISSLEKKLADERTKVIEAEVVADADICTSKSPTAAAIENIKASITSSNTAALEGYMATSVNTIYAATEGIGPSTSAKSVAAITGFISDATSPWDFELTASILSSYGSGYKNYFPNNAVVGKAADGKVISFSFDCNGKIDTVFMAISEELLYRT